MVRVSRWLAWAGVLAMSACTGSGTGPAPLPTHEGGAEDGRITGVLGGSATEDGGCLWLERGEERFPVLWPEGHTARFDPIALLGPDGQVVAEQGDRIVGGGGYYQETMPRCGLGRDSVIKIKAITVE